MQSALQLLFPPQCVGCHELVDQDFALCPDCWQATPFIHGQVCDQCGVPLPGRQEEIAIKCDDCLQIARPWRQGRAALLYQDKARALTLALKHGDRTDLASPAGRWMAQAAFDVVQPDMLVAPIPLYWSRLFRRRYNQAALLAHQVAYHCGLSACPDLLQRTRHTPSLDGFGRTERFATLSGAIRVHPRHESRVAGKQVLLIDDVMTSGATLATASEACLAADASDITILVLARVTKDT